jgi:hypothetical protein
LDTKHLSSFPSHRLLRQKFRVTIFGEKIFGTDFGVKHRKWRRCQVLGGTSTQNLLSQFKREVSMKDALNDIEAAQHIGVAAQTMRNYRCLGLGPVYHKVGRRVIYLKRDLDAYLAERRIDPEARRGAP